jgi:hypothetical protein
MQCIFVSTRLRRWYPLQRRHKVRLRYCCALTASFRAIAPALVHCPAVDTAFGAAMLAGVPLAFTFGLDTCAVDKEVQWTFGASI